MGSRLIGPSCKGLNDGSVGVLDSAFRNLDVNSHPYRQVVLDKLASSFESPFGHCDHADGVFPSFSLPEHDLMWLVSCPPAAERAGLPRGHNLSGLCDNCDLRVHKGLPVGSYIGFADWEQLDRVVSVGFVSGLDPSEPVGAVFSTNQLHQCHSLLRTEPVNVSLK